MVLARKVAAADPLARPGRSGRAPETQADFPSGVSSSPVSFPAVEPDSARGLRDLEVLVGAWRIEGRSTGSPPISIGGRTDTRWSRDGRTLEQRTLLVVDRKEIPAIEIIRFDPATQTFPAVVYTDGSTEPQQCAWRISGDRLVHSVPEATFRGHLSADRRAIRGRWTPRDRSSSNAESSYAATLRRID